jgi:hypothetical protein
MNVKHHLSVAWNLLFVHIVPLVLLTLVMFGLSMLTLGILAPVLMAGYLHAVLLLVRSGRPPEIGDLFLQMRLFFPLFIFSVAVSLMAMLGFLLLIVPGVLIGFAVTFVCLYLLPLMTDRQLGLMDALSQSYTMAVKENAAEHLVIVILFVSFLAIGGSIAVGSIFTTPFAALFVMSIYDAKTSGLDLAHP